MDKIQNTMGEGSMVSEEDLLKQIDEFREKALKLQSMISDQEQRAKNLEDEVREKEHTNTALDAELLKKREAAESIVGEVNDKVDKIMNSLSEDVKESVGTLGEDLKTTKSEITDKIHNENVTVYRNIQDLLKEMDKNDELSKMIESRVHGIRIQNVVLMIFSILNFGVGIIILLLTLGII
ncbi:MAG: hypothetical protein K6A69_06680 [Lachnospiraceae bacterium]|nr:hypothetical protein [Lachnospiraceae bacterium]